MADITMCSNIKCDLSGSCYRFLAIANEYYQSYADFKQDENGDCENYWEYNQEE
jgi:hypothetical protein